MVQRWEKSEWIDPISESVRSLALRKRRSSQSAAQLVLLMMGRPQRSTLVP